MNDLSRVTPLLQGRWAGPTRLIMQPDDPGQTSESTLAATPVAGGKFLRIDYTWAHDGKPQDGSILIGVDRKQGRATGLWVDSFHTDPSMNLLGQITADNTIDLLGSYSYPGMGDWGWRVKIQPAGDRVVFQMFNIAPDDPTEYLAVDAEYRR